MPTVRVMSEDSLDRVGRSSTLGRSNDSLLSDRSGRQSFGRGSKSQESLLSDTKTADGSEVSGTHRKSVEFLDSLDEEASADGTGKKVKRSKSKKEGKKFGSLLRKKNKSMDGMGTM